MIPSHINSLIFCWGAENSYFLEPRKAATVHQIWKLGHLFRLLRGNVDVNIQLENVSTASSVRKESRSYNYYSLFFQSIFKLAFLLFFLAVFFFFPFSYRFWNYSLLIDFSDGPSLTLVISRPFLSTVAIEGRDLYHTEVKSPLAFLPVLSHTRRVVNDWVSPDLGFTIVLHLFCLGVSGCRSGVNWWPQSNGKEDFSKGICYPDLHSVILTCLSSVWKILIWKEFTLNN